MDMLFRVAGNGKTPPGYRATSVMLRCKCGFGARTQNRKLSGSHRERNFPVTKSHRKRPPCLTVVGDTFEGLSITALNGRFEGRIALNFELPIKTEEHIKS
jgi:hypothetical protein